MRKSSVHDSDSINGTTSFHVAIVGGGPAGLSAALLLGRCGRKVILFDDNEPRNAQAQHVNGFLTRDGVDPDLLRQMARTEVQNYGVLLCESHVEDIEHLVSNRRKPKRTQFRVHAIDKPVLCRKVLLATGVRDVLPDIPGFKECFGRSVFHCPYCDGWEHRNLELAALGKTVEDSVGLALALRVWSRRVCLLADGKTLSRKNIQRLRSNGIKFRTERIQSADHLRGELRGFRFIGGDFVNASAAFLNFGHRPRSKLPEKLGCAMHNGQAATSRKQATRVAGVFVAGDADGDVQFAIIAAAEGAKAAVAINREIQEEDQQAAERPSMSSLIAAQKREKGLRHFSI